MECYKNLKTNRSKFIKNYLIENYSESVLLNNVIHNLLIILLLNLFLMNKLDRFIEQKQVY